MQNGHRVLFLSRRNSARSVMAEAILKKVGKGRFEAASAAVEPAFVIEPTVLELLRNADYPIDNPKPRHFGEYARAGAINLDFVFTLSDTARRQGPARMAGLERRLNILINLPFSSLDRMSLQNQVRRIGDEKND